MTNEYDDVGLIATTFSGFANKLVSHPDASLRTKTLVNVIKRRLGSLEHALASESLSPYLVKSLSELAVAFDQHNFVFAKSKHLEMVYKSWTVSTAEWLIGLRTLILLLTIFYQQQQQ